MNRIKARLLWLGLILGVCFLPLLVFMIQDSFVIGKNIELDYQDDEYEIARNHPIIASLYSEYYSDFNPIEAPKYNIREELSLGKNKDKIKKMQGYFDEEMNKILQAQVIPYSLIELEEKETFKTNFGYIQDLTGELGNTLHLTQYYRFHTDNDVSTFYEYSQFSKKIKSLRISNKDINKLTDDNLKKMCWNMISYLELDDIDDWEYSDYAYESKKAKIFVRCYIERYESFDSLTIDVSLTDIYTNYLLNSIQTY